MPKKRTPWLPQGARCDECGYWQLFSEERHSCEAVRLLRADERHVIQDRGSQAFMSHMTRWRRPGGAA